MDDDSRVIWPLRGCRFALAVALLGAPLYNASFTSAVWAPDQHLIDSVDTT